jgi:hypothetical protein
LDLLYPPDEQPFLVSHPRRATDVTLLSEHGHDGFLIDSAEMAAFINEFRWGLVSGGPGAPPQVCLNVAPPIRVPGSGEAG